MRCHRGRHEPNEVTLRSADQDAAASRRQRLGGADRIRAGHRFPELLESDLGTGRAAPRSLEHRYVRTSTQGRRRAGGVQDTCMALSPSQTPSWKTKRPGPIRLPPGPGLNEVSEIGADGIPHVAHQLNDRL